MELAHHESEDRFRIVAHEASVMIRMSGQDGLSTFFNQRWLDFTGRTMEQELGNGWVESVHPDDVPVGLDTYQSAIQTQQPYSMEYPLRRANGDYRWILDTGTPQFKQTGPLMDM